MNLGELRTNVYDLGYEQLDDRVDRALNRVYRRVLGMWRWDFLCDTATDDIAAGDGDVDLPSDFKRVDALYLYDAQGAQIDFTFLPYTQFQEVSFGDDGSAAAEGVPEWWSERGNQIVFYPRADAVYSISIEYVLHAPDLDQDTDEPLLPVEYHDVLVYGAAAELAARERDGQSYAILSGAHTTRLAEMIAEHGVRQRQNARQVKRSKFWSSIRSYG